MSEHILDDEIIETFDQTLKTLLEQQKQEEALQTLASELKNTTDRMQQWQNVLNLLGDQLAKEEEEKAKAKEEEKQQQDAPYRALAKSLNKNR